MIVCVVFVVLLVASVLPSMRGPVLYLFEKIESAPRQICNYFQSDGTHCGDRLASMLLNHCLLCELFRSAAQIISRIPPLGVR